MQFFQLIKNPVFQGLFYLVLTFAVLFIVRPRAADNVWVVCGLIYCVFILANSVLVLYETNIWQYFFISLAISLVYLLVISFTVSIFINALKLDGSEESSMIFIVIIYHPLVLLLAIFVKWVL